MGPPSPAPNSASTIRSKIISDNLSGGGGATSDLYRNLFPIDGKTFDTDRVNWQARLTNDPGTVHSDRVCYVIEFQSLGASGSERRFTLWASAAALHHDPNKAYQALLFSLITDFLNSELVEDERAYFG